MPGRVWAFKAKRGRIVPSATCLLGLSGLVWGPLRLEAVVALASRVQFAAERDHEMGCLEAVRRTQEGYKITNRDQFERKKLDGKVLITRKDSQQRISGNEVKLSSDLP